MGSEGARQGCKDRGCTGDNCGGGMQVPYQAGAPVLQPMFHKQPPASTQGCAPPSMHFRGLLLLVHRAMSRTLEKTPADRLFAQLTVLSVTVVLDRSVCEV